MNLIGIRSILDLFARISAGDRNAFNELYGLYYSKLLIFANQMVKDRNLSEDIVTDLFVKIWIKRKDIEKIEKPQFYLYKAIKNSCLNEVSKRSIETVEIEDNIGLEEINDPSGILIDKELFALLNEAINTLPNQRKLIFILFREEGLKQKEIAELMNVSVRTVENQLYRAVKTLALYVEVYLSRENEKILRSKNNFNLFTF